MVVGLDAVGHERVALSPSFLVLMQSTIRLACAEEAGRVDLDVKREDADRVRLSPADALGSLLEGHQGPPHVDAEATKRNGERARGSLHRQGLLVVQRDAAGDDLRFHDVGQDGHFDLRSAAGVQSTSSGEAEFYGTMSVVMDGWIV